MTLSGRAIAAMLAVATIGALFSSVATARARLETSVFEYLSRGTVTLNSGMGSIIICAATFHSTLRRLVNKLFGDRHGDITAILTANCRDNSGGAARVAFLAPWQIDYGSIAGSLPSIRGVLLLATGGLLIDITIFGLNARCLYRGTIGLGAVENPASSFTFLANSIPLFASLGGTLTCPETGELVGTLTNSTSVFWRLLER